MRIRVSDVVGLVRSGAEFEGILVDCPYVEREDTEAALGYGAEEADGTSDRLDEAQFSVLDRGAW
jgi:uncharacterized protein (DUF433 family)